jgi:hypothetical protein
MIRQTAITLLGAALGFSLVSACIRPPERADCHNPILSSYVVTSADDDALLGATLTASTEAVQLAWTDADGAAVVVSWAVTDIGQPWR